MITHRHEIEPLEGRMLLSATPYLGPLAEQTLVTEQAYHIYQNRDDGNNKAITSWVLNDADSLTINTGSVRAGGDTATQVDWRGGGSAWSGLGFVQPEGYVGVPVSEPGLSLFGDNPAPKNARLTFSARIHRPDVGDSVEFGYGGTGGDSTEGDRKWITLSPRWKTYSFDVSGKILSAMHLAFLANVNDMHDINNDGVTFFIDDIRYNWQRPTVQRLATSYNVLPELATAFDITHPNAAFVYDQAVDILALGAGGGKQGLRLADRVGQALLTLLKNDWDPNPPDGSDHVGSRLHTAYMNGEPLDVQTGLSRPAGWWDVDAEAWYIHNYGIDAGNNAWAMLAFEDLYQKTGEKSYLHAATQIGRWIASELATPDGGYRIGWKSDGLGGYLYLDVKSVEHNLDLYAAFWRLAQFNQALGKTDAAAVWEERMLDAGNFVMSMYDPAQGRFYTGTDQTGTPTDHHALDAQTWTLLALGQGPHFADAIDWRKPIRWAEEQFAVRRNGFAGFDFGYNASDADDHDVDGIWWEGTAQMALAYRALGEVGNYLDTLAAMRKFHRSHGGGLLHAADADTVSTGIINPDGNAWRVFKRGSIGATGWAAFAEMGYNPFWSGTINWTSANEPNNGPNTATPIGVIPTVKAGGRHFGVIGKSDRRNLFRFKIDSATPVRVQLAQLQFDADIELLRVIKSPNGSRRLERIATSTRPGIRNDVIRRDLAAGVYYIRVLSDSREETGYALNVWRQRL